MANANLVAAIGQPIDTTSHHATQHKDNRIPSQQPRPHSSPVSSTSSPYLPLVWRSLQSQGISTTASDIIVRAWRQGTIKQYKPHLCKWESYCHKRKIDPLRATAAEGTNFLADLFQSGAGYSTINAARSALSYMKGHPLVSRLLKGVFELRPALPKYQSIWDISVVLNLLGSWQIPNISLKYLSLKLTMLLAFTTGQRVQTLQTLDINNMTLRVNECVFVINSVLKTTKPGKHLSSIQIQALVDNKNLCPVEHLKLCMDKTSAIRGLHTQLLLSYQKPHRPVSTDTIPRWIKVVLTEAGINTAIFSAHSTRAASTSAAYRDKYR